MSGLLYSLSLSSIQCLFLFTLKIEVPLIQMHYLHAMQISSGFVALSARGNCQVDSQREKKKNFPQFDDGIHNLVIKMTPSVRQSKRLPTLLIQGSFFVLSPTSLQQITPPFSMLVSIPFLLVFVEAGLLPPGKINIPSPKDRKENKHTHTHTLHIDQK